MWFGVFAGVGFINSVLSLSLSSTFSLQNAPAALTSLATSASASASSPLAPMTHIANLRKKQQKAEQLQSEKLQAEDDADISNLSVEAAGEGVNEAAPSLFQKKLGKILTKIRFISSLTGGASGGGGDGEGNTNETEESESTDNNSTTTMENGDQFRTPNDLETDVKTSEESVTERAQTFQKVIYPHSNFGPPLKVRLNLNERIVNKPQPEGVVEQSQNIQSVEETSRLSQIGVFFAEILGSIVGLLYGAAAHITSANGQAH